MSVFDTTIFYYIKKCLQKIIFVIDADEAYSLTDCSL